MRPIKKVLAIETSCDDTSIAIVGEDGFVFDLVSASQDSVHSPFGGIVPEIACRNHSFQILPLIDQILRSAGGWPLIDGIVVTNRPGLVGSLIVGIATAKSLAQSQDKPILGVNHLEGHLLAPFLRDEKYKPSFDLGAPFLAMAVSGGHTSLYKINRFGQYIILGSTRDDAAGEAFDKFAKMVGLGFPGGVQVDRMAREGDPCRFQFPRGLIKEETYEMSFSGLKAAAQRVVSTMAVDEINESLADLCASYQEAICDVLITKLDRAMAREKIKQVVLTGGVSANSRLRALALEWAKAKGVHLLVPPLRYCTDNAAMIGYAGILRLNRGERSDLTMGPSPRSLLGDFSVHHE